MTALLASLVIGAAPYAEVFCRLRQAGWPDAAALRAATAVSLRPGKPQLITVGRWTVRRDVFDAQVAALELCPDL